PSLLRSQVAVELDVVDSGRVAPRAHGRGGGGIVCGARARGEQARIGELLLDVPVFARDRERAARLAVDLEREARFFAQVNAIAAMIGAVSLATTAQLSRAAG